MREHFLLDDDVVFLNHGSFGACPRPVFADYQRLQRELERNPVRFLALERELPARLDEARAVLAAYVGATLANLVFVPNTSAALNAVVRSLELGPRDEILMGDCEYDGMEILWQHVARGSGATIVRRPFAELEPGPRTRVVFCSHVEWSTGRVNDLAPMLAAARAAGAISIVDGAHAPGQIPLELDELAPDVYAGNAHKWLCAPKGAAFLYVREHLHPVVEPAVVSWDWQPDAPFATRHRWQGTRDPAAYLAVPAAIAFQDEHDWPSVRRGCHELLASLELPLSPLADDYVQMRGFRVDHPSPLELRRHLQDELKIEVPVFETRHGWVLRVSVQAYNDERDLDALASALT
ncbi:MAG TPA: aminotransferase class V-fold PLP-dependent enzyme [Gaiellaceae bacterium]|nr:aminotransferase class V-fold PLP-dependent enzyme [Gaiellaceae bacterium]